VSASDRDERIAEAIDLAARKDPHVYALVNTGRAAGCYVGADEVILALLESNRRLYEIAHKATLARSPMPMARIIIDPEMPPDQVKAAFLTLTPKG
jgi:hypothetical protein